jgi:hypothetical protein
MVSSLTVRDQRRQHGRVAPRSRSINPRTIMCCAVACVMLAACQSVSEVRQKPVVPRWARPLNPKAPMSRVDLNPPFRLGIHPAADDRER